MDLTIEALILRARRMDKPKSASRTLLGVSLVSRMLAGLMSMYGRVRCGLGK